MLDQNVIFKIAAHCDVQLKSLEGFDLSCFGFDTSILHPSVVDYFAIVPNVSIHAESFSSRDLCRLCGQSELKHQNEDFIPNCNILSSGFVTFGSDPCGDAFAVNVYDGNVYIVSHEISWDEEIDVGGSNTTENQRIIEESSEFIAESIAEFLSMLLDRLDETDAQEREFRNAAANDPNATDRSGNTQLIYAVRSGDLDDARRQIEAGADIEYYGKTEHRNALGESVVFGHPDILQFLIDRGADVNATNKDGETALMLGALYSQQKCIELLLRAGADRGMRDRNGQKAYDRICVIHGTPAIKQLLRDGEYRSNP